MTISRPPLQSTDSLRDRKWKESLTRTTSTSEADTAAVVTAVPSTALPNSRTLSGSASVSVSDGGPGGSITIAVADSGVTPGSYSSADITVDAKGRITAAATGTGGTGGGYKNSFLLMGG